VKNPQLVAQGATRLAKRGYHAQQSDFMKRFFISGAPLCR
jgi:hypothetical protein